MIIKTYEGFFDFMKSKTKPVEKESVDFLDIYACIQDIVEDPDIKNAYRDKEVDGSFYDHNAIVGLYKCSDIDISNKLLTNYKMRYNVENLIVYNPGGKGIIVLEISVVDNGDSDRLRDLLLETSSKLNHFGCKLSYYFIPKDFYKNWEKNVIKEYTSIDKVLKDIPHEQNRGISSFIENNLCLSLKIEGPIILPTGLKINNGRYSL